MMRSVGYCYGRRCHFECDNILVKCTVVLICDWPIYSLCGFLLSSAIACCVLLYIFFCLSVCLSVCFLSYMSGTNYMYVCMYVCIYMISSNVLVVDGYAAVIS